MNAFAAHFSFEFRTGIRNKTLLFMNYLFPLSFFLMMGAIMPGINPMFLENMTPALVVFALLAATLLGLPDPLVSARESGIFRSYKINGVPKASILALPALTTGLHMMIVSAIITAAAPLLFNAPTPVNWFNFAVVFLAFSLSCLGLAVLIGVIAPSTRLTVLYSQLFFIPSMLLGGLMLPYDMLPEAAGVVAQLLPATHAMNAFTGLAMGGASVFSPWGSVAALAASGVIAFVLALYLFSWDRQNNGRRRQPLSALLVLVPFVIGWFIF